MVSFYIYILRFSLFGTQIQYYKEKNNILKRRFSFILLIDVSENKNYFNFITMQLVQ